MRVSSALTVAVLLSGSVVVAGCVVGPDLVAEVAALDIQPDTAEAGDAVVFSVGLAVAPEQWFVLAAIVDGTDYQTERQNVQFSGRVEIQLGDAADLIDQYGTGTHVGRVELRLEESGRVFRTGDVLFVLQ